MQYPKVTIIILNWNGLNDTLECLESVRHIDYPNFDVICVDNGSNDNSVKVIQNNFPEATVLETGENLGFAGGNNVGIRYALKNGADYILLLNNDTIVDSQILKSFVTASRALHQKVILGAKIYYYSEPKMIWYAGARWVDEISHFLHIGQRCVDDGTAFNDVVETDYVCGCAFFAKADIFEKVGILDEKFFLTFEETDFCYRARRAGYRSFLVPEARLWHKVSTSFGGEGSPIISYFLARNRLLWAKKNLPFLQRLRLYKRVLGEVLRYVLPPRPGRLRELNAETLSEREGAFFSAYGRAILSKYRNPVMKARLVGMRDYLLHRFGDCPDSVRLLLRQRSG